MKLKGNYYLLFGSQLFSGIITYFLCVQYDIWGVILGFIPFLIGMLLVMPGHKPDEREMELTHKSNSWEGIFTAVIMGVVYVFFPDVNWFYVFISAISLVRGLAGMILFSIY